MKGNISKSKGFKGDKGEPGKDGYTPKKGTDYFTPDEVESIRQYILDNTGISRKEDKSNKVNCLSGTWEDNFEETEKYPSMAVVANGFLSMQDEIDDKIDLVVNITLDEEEHFVSDIPNEEIISALDSGRNVIVAVGHEGVYFKTSMVTKLVNQNSNPEWFFIQIDNAGLLKTMWYSPYENAEYPWKFRGSAELITHNNGYFKEEVDNKFNNYILAPTTANVGQTIIVKEVDESGKPTVWEAVDVSGGNTEWELISDVDTTEEVGEISLSIDTSGNTFELGDVCAHVIIPMHDSAITPLFRFIEVDGYEADISTTTDGNYTELVISRKDDKAMIKLEQYKYSSLKTTTINPRSFPVGNLVYYHNIKEFKAYLYGNEVFPKGTRVRLYGKRV